MKDSGPATPTRDSGWFWRLAAVAVLGAGAWLTGNVFTGSAQGVPIELVDARPGGAVYAANCSACHQATGAGLKRAVPPLSGNVPSLLSRPGGRSYLISAVLFGLSGEVTAAGERYDGVMPSWHHLSDAQLAAVLNFIATNWGNLEALPAGVVAFTPLEVSMARAQVMTSREVAQSRPEAPRR